MKTNVCKDTSYEVHRRIYQIIDHMPETEVRNLLIGLEKWKQSKIDCKRKHARKDTFISALVSTNGRSYRGYITNISASGLFVEVKIIGSVQHGVFMEFVHPVFDHSVKVTCKIVRNSRKGVGVKFGRALPM